MKTVSSTTRLLTGALALFTVSVLSLPSGPAGAVSAKVRSACGDDYRRFCPAYEPSTAQARQCMRQAGRRLSKRCVDALQDSGEVPRRKK